MRSADTLQRHFPRHSACDPGSSLGLLRLCLHWYPFSSSAATLIQQFISILYDSTLRRSAQDAEILNSAAFCSRYCSRTPIGASNTERESSDPIISIPTQSPCPLDRRLPHRPKMPRSNPPRQGIQYSAAVRVMRQINQRDSMLTDFLAEHVQLLLSQSQEVMNSSIAHYKMILRGIFDTSPIIPQTSTNPEGRPVTSLTSNYLCLQCPVTVEEADRLDHGTEKLHRFCMWRRLLWPPWYCHCAFVYLLITTDVDSRNGSLYCQICDDFVWDPTFEELRVRKIGTGTFSSTYMLSSARFKKAFISLFVPLSSST